jgi:hypothetical protein
VRPDSPKPNLAYNHSFAAAAEIAVTLSTVFYCLLTDAHAYSRLVEELRNAATNGDYVGHKNSFL